MIPLEVESKIKNDLLDEFKNDIHPSVLIEDFVDKFYLLPNQFVYVHHVKQGRFYSKGIKEVLGFDLEMLTPDFFVKHIHPIDLSLVFKVSKAFHKAVLDHFKSIDSQKISLELNYRIRKYDGAYVPIIRHTLPFQFGNQNKVEAFISVCTEISFINSSSQILWRVNNLGEGIFDKYLNINPKNAQSIFSGREVEVLKLIMSGYSSSRIANALFVSVNTVNTHRKSLMRKANVNKTVDLISFAIENGFSK